MLVCYLALIASCVLLGLCFGLVIALFCLVLVTGVVDLAVLFGC